MNSFFRRLPLMAKLLIIAVIPLFFAAFLTAQLYKEKSKNMEQIKGYLDKIDQSALLTRLTNQLQTERRFSFEYALRKIHFDDMHAQRPITDSLIEELEKEDKNTSGFTSYCFIDNIDSVRNRIDRGSYTPNAIMHFYSTAAFRLSNLNRAPSVNNNLLGSVYNDLVVQKLLSEIITYHSIISANIYNLLYTRQYVVETLFGTLPSYDVYKLVEKELLAKANASLLKRYVYLKDHSALQSSQKYLHQVFTTFKVDSSYTVDQWKDTAVKSIDELRTFQTDVLTMAKQTMNDFYKKEQRAQTTTIFILIVISCLIVMLTTYIVMIINKSLQEIRKGALKLAEGKADISISPQSNDAIGSLASSIYKIDEKNKELSLAAKEIGKGNFDVPVLPRSPDDVLGNAIVQMKESLLRYTTDLNKSREEFIKLADFMPQIVWTARPDGYFDYYNKKWYEITGAKEGYGDQSWIPFFHPADVGYSLTTWYHSVETGEPYQIEYRLKDIRSNSYRWFLGRALPIKDENGKVLKWFGTATDIHDQKIQNEKLEELVTQRTLELNRSNEDLQQFAHVASHDLKEPLRKIRTFSDRLATEFGSFIPEKGKTYIQKLQNSSERMANMIDGILNYSIINATEQVEETIDLNLVLEGIKNDLELLILNKDARISYQQLPKLKGVPTLIYQLFYNLINNALKFSKENVPSYINITSKRILPSQLDGITDIEKANHYLHLTITDNGIGFNQEYADKMFNVFTRLNGRDQFEGTGLGLALCKKIVHRHHGVLYAKGVEGEGSEFHIIFPDKL